MCCINQKKLFFRSFVECVQLQKHWPSTKKWKNCSNMGQKNIKCLIKLWQRKEAKKFESVA